MEVATIVSHFFPSSRMLSSPTISKTTNPNRALTSSFRNSSLSTNFIYPFVGGSVNGSFSGQKIRPDSLNPFTTSSSGSRGKRGVVTMVPFFQLVHFYIQLVYFIDGHCNLHAKFYLVPLQEFYWHWHPHTYAPLAHMQRLMRTQLLDINRLIVGKKKHIWCLLMSYHILVAYVTSLGKKKNTFGCIWSEWVNIHSLHMSRSQWC